MNNQCDSCGAQVKDICSVCWLCDVCCSCNGFSGGDRFKDEFVPKTGEGFQTSRRRRGNKDGIVK